MRATDRLRTGLGEPEVLHLSLLDQMLHRARHILDRDVGIDAVLIKQVDRVDSESIERCLDDLSDASGAAIQTGTGSGGGILESEFRGDHNASLERSEGFANELFVVSRTIDFGGVEKGDAALDCGAQDGD